MHINCQFLSVYTLHWSPMSTTFYILYSNIRICFFLYKSPHHYQRKEMIKEFFLTSNQYPKSGQASWISFPQDHQIGPLLPEYSFNSFMIFQKRNWREGDEVVNKLMYSLWCMKSGREWMLINLFYKPRRPRNLLKISWSWEITLG